MLNMNIRLTYLNYNIIFTCLNCIFWYKFYLLKILYIMNWDLFLMTQTLNVHMCSCIVFSLHIFHLFLRSLFDHFHIYHHFFTNIVSFYFLMILLCLFYTHKIIIPFLMQMNIKDLESQTSEKVMDHELSNLTDAILHERFDEKKKSRIGSERWNYI